MKSIKAKLQTRKPGGGLLGAELAELAKAATAKDVPQPDEELNQMVRRRAVWAHQGFLSSAALVLRGTAVSDPHLSAPRR